MNTLVDFCRSVASAAPKTPFLYYHYPGITGVNLPVFDFFDKAHGVIPTLRGTTAEPVSHVLEVWDCSHNQPPSRQVPSSLALSWATITGPSASRVTTAVAHTAAHAHNTHTHYSALTTLAQVAATTS